MDTADSHRAFLSLALGIVLRLWSEMEAAERQHLLKQLRRLLGRRGDPQRIIRRIQRAYTGPPEISRRLLVLMNDRGLTASALAELVGVSPQRVSAWINAESRPQPNSLLRIATALDTDVATLTGDDDGSYEDDADDEYADEESAWVW